MKISVMITSQNRSAELERTLRVLRTMNPPADELIITLDACTDDSQLTVMREYPRAWIVVNTSACGSVSSRNTMLHQATGELVVSLDDDSYPVDLDFFGRLERIFSAHPEAAVVSFPEQRDNNIYASESKTPRDLGHYVAAYANCAAAMRRSFYLQQPGFPPSFVHMYEEPDYALQCYAAGSAVWFEPSLTIRHHLSSNQRKPVHRHHQNARNELWSVWLRCPFPQVFIVSLFRIWRQFRYACSEGLDWAIQEPRWWIETMTGLARCVRQRQPVLWLTYHAWMRLARHPINSLDELRRVFHV